jgi:hypothetical protein
MSGFDTEEIIRMAREAGWGFSNSRDSDFVKAQLKFAELVAAAEREACAQAAEAVVPRHTECGNKIAVVIRARGNNAA